MIKISDFRILTGFSLLLLVIFLALSSSCFTAPPDPSQRSHAVQFSPPTSEQEGDEAYRSALAIFEGRILPIMNSPSPSSCSECHLSGVDLKDYIQESPEKTFISLRDQGLVNLQQPSESKILDMIRMNQPNSSLLTQAARQRELEAFAAWIEACCQSQQLVSAPPLPKEELAMPPVPVEVIRHARTDRVFGSFVTNVWSQIQRCAPCHSNRNPKRLEELIEKHDEQVWWCFDTPEATFNSIIDRGYIDTDTPWMSLLLMKPTLQLEHGGGLKMEIGDRGYKQFHWWIEDYAAVMNGVYKSPEELPKDSEVEFIASQIWLKVAPTPEAWADKLLGVFVFPFDERTGRDFSKQPDLELKIP